MGTMCPNHTEQNQGHDPGTGERHSMYADQGDTTEVCPTGRHGSVFLWTMERLGGVFEWCTEKAQRGPTRGTGVSEAGGQNPRLLGAPQSSVKEAPQWTVKDFVRT